MAREMRHASLNFTVVKKKRWKTGANMCGVWIKSLRPIKRLYLILKFEVGILNWFTL